MIPEDVLRTIGTSPPRLRNEDRPFLVWTSSPTTIPADFGAAIAAGLRNGSIGTTRNPTPDSCDPASEGRCFSDHEHRPRLRNHVARSHEILIDWNGMEDIIAMAGMMRRDVDLDTLCDLDGTSVPDRVAIQRIACVSAEIAARTLVSPTIDQDARESLHDLLAAFAAASHVTVPGETLVIMAPSPWGPAKIGSFRINDDFIDHEIGYDPSIEAILPVAMRVQVMDDPDDLGIDRIRIDQLSFSVNHENMPTAMEAARTLARGWPAP
jgi:hypothetical protein